MLIRRREATTETPGNVADHPIEHFRFIRPQRFEHRPRDQPHADIRECHGGGRVRQVV